MEVLVLFLAALTLPGWALSGALKLDVCRTAVSIALSLSILVVCLAAARVAGLGVEEFGYLLAAGYATVVVAAAWTWRRGGFRLGSVYWIPMVTMAAVAVYALWAGPYTEVPADGWWHIGHINDRLEMLAGGAVGRYDEFADLFEKSAQYWHTLAAYSLYISGMELTRALGAIATANTLLIAAAVYSFALLVFEEFVPSRRMQHAAAAGAVFFFGAQFGVSVFSYVRYYSFAPALLNYVVYLAALGCFLHFLRLGRGGYRYLAMAGLLTVVAAAVHTQEAALVVIMAGLIVVWEYIMIARHAGPAWILRPSAYAWEGRPRTALLLFGLGIAYLLVHGFAYTNLPRHNPLNHGVMADIHNYVPFLQNLYVLKPTFQFYQVLTIWGALVYLLFVFHLRELQRNHYLVAGMALPFLTVFNPVFTDFFLRFSWPEVLWRVCYALPLPFVGGYFLARSGAAVLGGPGVGARLAGLVILIALIGLLLPIQTTFVNSPHSKVYTLARVGPDNDHRLWADLMHYLEGQEGEGLITDPVTGYVAASLTGHRYPGYKFFGRDGFPVDRDLYRSQQFAERDGWLVVINRRDGAPSAAGRYGRHWPEDVMKVSKRYSDAFVDYVTGHAGEFEKLWSRNGIDVYRVTAS